MEKKTCNCFWCNHKQGIKNGITAVALWVVGMTILVPILKFSLCFLMLLLEN